MRDRGSSRLSKAAVWAQIRALRRKLENMPSPPGTALTEPDSAPKDISVFLWPAHRIVHLPEGTTAGQVLRTQVPACRMRSQPCSRAETGKDGLGDCLLQAQVVAVPATG